MNRRSFFKRLLVLPCLVLLPKIKAKPELPPELSPDPKWKYRHFCIQKGRQAGFRHGDFVNYPDGDLAKAVKEVSRAHLDKTRFSASPGGDCLTIW